MPTTSDLMKRATDSDVLSLDIASGPSVAPVKHKEEMVTHMVWLER